MRWLGMTVLAACNFSTSLTRDGKVDAAIDAAIDAPPDAFDDKCFGKGSLYFCLAARPSTTELLDNNDFFNTDNCTAIVNGSKGMIGTQEVCVIAANTITLNANQTTSVSGSLPLVLAAATSIRIDGFLDASSTETKRGPGASLTTQCSAGLDGTAGVAVGGGGAGGTFASAGGNGGSGNGIVAGGIATMPAPKPTSLRAGCKGGTGMPGTAVSAPGGAGGGVVFLASQGTLTINGRISAAGAWGIGGATKGGGGGGGSGGMIVLDSIMPVSIGLAAKLNANGGGGGAGGNVIDGANGSPPDPDMPLVPARGGQPNMGTSQGGDGAAASTQATAGESSLNGGGGGGGGIGWIRVLRGPMPVTGQFSPAPVN